MLRPAPASTRVPSISTPFEAPTVKLEPNAAAWVRRPVAMPDRSPPWPVMRTLPPVVSFAPVIRTPAPSGGSPTGPPLVQSRTVPVTAMSPLAEDSATE
ncbi:hypothetical protein QFZ47_003060 [Variovorax paradoxus]|nr:hypothetical protein [Variovorax paradoxus]